RTSGVVPRLRSWWLRHQRLVGAGLETVGVDRQCVGDVVGLGGVGYDVQKVVAGAAISRDREVQRVVAGQARAYLGALVIPQLYSYRTARREVGVAVEIHLDAAGRALPVDEFECQPVAGVFGVAQLVDQLE